MTSKDVKPRIDFAPTAADPIDERIQSAQHFDEQTAAQYFTPSQQQDLLVNSEQEITLEQSLKPKPSWWRKCLLLGVVILLVSSIAQLAQSIITAWQDKQWFSLGLTTAGAMIVVAALGALFSEFSRLRRLKKQTHIHHQAEKLLLSEGQGEGLAFCEQLIKNSGLPADHSAIATWRTALTPSLNDSEVLRLYSSLVQPTIDQQARRLIRQTATHSALMVAASPYALVDMALVAWRSLRMVNHIARVYQVEPGYFGRIKLLRSIMINMALAGASEWIQDSSIDWLSQDLAARLSARVAQGLGIGVLTARLGIKAMALCRPIPWLEGQAPKVSEFRRGLLTDLNEQMRSRK